jgi:hypothetical protein
LTGEANAGGGCGASGWLETPRQLAGADENERRRHKETQDRGKDEGEDGDDDNKAIGGNDNAHHPKQQSTNNGGKQMWMTVWGGTCGREAAKPPEAEVSAVK